MCGLITIIYKDPNRLVDEKTDHLEHIGRAMVDTLRHRGPDESKVVRMGNAVLGHTRLSIIDLSTGSQPILNEDNNVAVLLNGEIYNFPELKISMMKKGHVFRTNTDTEVIVHLYEEYGEEVFTYLNGMFAIVIYDIARNVLLAARDRMGEKPILFWESNELLIIASELKSILVHPQVERQIDPQALGLYLNSMYVPAPLCIFKGIKKLAPAHFLRFENGKVTLKQYWRPMQSIRWDWRLEDINDVFIELFSNAVKIRTISDVPIGVFLSGGIDSSAVTAFMSLAYQGAVKTFTVGFEDEIDERPYAKLVADRYHTEHTELFVTDQIDAVMQSVIEYFDEPFGDSSAIPTYLVAREARKHVKVILTGDGGDELFAGYGSYIDQKYLLGGRISSFVFKKANQALIQCFKKGLLEACYARSSDETALSHWLWVRTISTQAEIEKSMRLSAPDIAGFFKHNRWLPFTGKDPLSIAFEHDFNYYLPDDLLKKVDMAAMLASLECRAPFLDHRLVEFAMQIPPILKVKNDVSKYLLKQMMTDYLPEPILTRKKTGFGAPVSSWLNGGLKGMTLDCLGTGSKLESILSKDSIQSCIQAFYDNKSSKNDYRTAFRVWLLLVLELWMRKYA